MNSLNDAFERASARNAAALIPYVVAGHPRPQDTIDIVEGMAEAGADLIELGVPFSDPIADGPVIRQAAHVALTQGTTLAWVIETVHELRKRGVKIPIALMGYTNPFLSYGLERLSSDIGGLVQGLIVADLPVDESVGWKASLAASNIHLVQIAAPTTPSPRLEVIAENASGFLYCIAVKGVTGARASISDDLALDIARYRRATRIPIAVGFGIATPAHVRSIAALADGVIVGSALVDRIASAPVGRGAQVATTFIRELKNATVRDNRAEGIR
jgi:tryptophan synthase alpha chain